MKRIVVSLFVAAVLVPVFFEVDLNPRFNLPATESRPDPVQEARYDACVEAFDRRIHAETFERVDNPDVQRELLYRQMQEAKATCRERFPEQTVSIDRPLEINVIDLRWRY